ncbi:MAG: phosphodiesterase [Silicimonas sp.]|nr:phosphodiesterase [Silicimonas sp.]
MLPDAFLRIPLTHRGLHDMAKGRPENSRGAVQAAVDLGYGIEVDVQLTADGEAVVFHDYALDRMTDGVGLVRRRTLGDLATLRLKGSGESVPSLVEVLQIVRGRVPLLIEIKDQDGALGDNVGELEAAVSAALDGYAGPVALMSFNPHSVAAMQALAPDIPRGLVTDPFRPEVWPAPEARLAKLRLIGDFDRVGACFISHDRRDLGAAPVQELKKRGIPVLCWTVRTPEQEAEAREVADNVTFEGYLAVKSA